MRPNIDIPWSIHGQIKEYAQANNLTIEEGYQKILKKGIEGTPLPVQEELEINKEVQFRQPFGPRVTPITDGDINVVSTFLPHINYSEQPVIFRGVGRRQLKDSEVNEILSRLAMVLPNYVDDWFTVHQLGGAWIGRGLENYRHTLVTRNQRLEEVNFQTYKTGLSTYIAEIGESDYLFIRTENKRGKNRPIEMKLGFLTDGHPIQDGKYTQFAVQLGFDKVTNSFDKKLPYLSAGFEDGIELEVIDRIPRQEQYENDNPIVGSFIAENPFQENPGLLESLSVENARERFEGGPSQIEKIRSYDHIYGALPDHHPKDDKKDYTMDAVGITDLSPIFGRERVYNVSISANW